MKFTISLLLLMTAFNSYAARISTDDFTVKLDYVNTTNTDAYRLVLGTSCFASSPFGYTDCWSDVRTVRGERISDNYYSFPRTQFVSKTDAAIKLFANFELHTRVSLRRSEDSTEVNESIVLYHNSSSKRLNITDDIRRHFEKTFYVTTIPSFSFKATGKLSSTRTSDVRELTTNSVNITINAIPLDESGDPIELVSSTRYPNTLSLKTQDVDNSLETTTNTKTLVTEVRPSAIRLLVIYRVNFFGRSRAITKVILADDLDNLDFSEMLSNESFEIVEDIQL